LGGLPIKLLQPIALLQPLTTQNRGEENEYLGWL